MKKWSYYNDNDPYILEWVRNLIKAGLISDGEVDGRSITEVKSEDIKGFIQCHFFCGIGGWSYALRLAGWPDDRPVWTASCPCPPFSVAGKQAKCPECKSACLVWCPRRTGFAICADCEHAWLADARHLWPEVWRLASESRPGCIFGEQVDSLGALVWLAAVSASLEILGYATGAEGLPASSVGAPHIRQRLWWVGWMGNTDESGSQGRRDRSDANAGQQYPWAAGEFIACDDDKARPVEPGIFPLADGLPQALDGGGTIPRIGVIRGAGNAIVPKCAAGFIRAWLDVRGAK